MPRSDSRGWPVFGHWMLDARREDRLTTAGRRVLAVVQGFLHELADEVQPMRRPSRRRRTRR
jgi:hypothetical protein